MCCYMNCGRPQESDPRPGNCCCGSSDSVRWSTMPNQTCWPGGGKMSDSQPNNDNAP